MYVHVTFNQQKFSLIAPLSLLKVLIYRGSKNRHVEFQSEQDCAARIKNLCSKSPNSLLWHKM